MTRAEHSFILGQPRCGTVAKAERVVLNGDMTVAEGFEEIVDNCVRHFRLNHPAVVEKRAPEALHQTRVALRRLRAATSLFRTAIADEESPWVREELRWLAGALGIAGDLDVAMRSMLTSEQRQVLLHRREAAYDNIGDVLQSVRFRESMMTLAAWTSRGNWRCYPIANMPLGPYVNRRIDKLWRKLKAAMRPSRIGDERRHQLRILVKKLRYSLEFVRSLHLRKPKTRRRLGNALEELQEWLGLLNDAAVARRALGDDPAIACQTATEEKRRLRGADRGLHRVREIGPYWR